MPHKTAKRSVREEQRLQRGSDQAPSSNRTSKWAISSEGIPKSVARVLNAAHVRQEWRDKKRRLESRESAGELEGRGKKRRIDGCGDAKGKGAAKSTGHHNTQTNNKMLAIQPGESLGHFNKRVEDDMRPLVKSAMQSSSAQVRKVKKAEQLDAKSGPKSQTAVSVAYAERNQTSSPEPLSKHDDRPIEFQRNSTSAPRRLNDIAKAPPELKKFSRAIKNGTDNAGRDGVLSMKQKLMMEEEREKAIARYRVLKERRRLDEVGGGERDGGHDNGE